MINTVTNYDKTYKNANGSYRKRARTGTLSEGLGHKAISWPIITNVSFSPIPGVDSKFGGDLRPSYANDGCGSYGAAGYTFTDVNPNRKWVKIVIAASKATAPGITKAEMNRASGSTAICSQYTELRKAGLLTYIGKGRWMSGPAAELLLKELGIN